MNETLIASENEIPRGYTLSFDQLYRRHSDGVFGYCISVLRDRSLAEEATSVIFERAFRHRRLFDPGRATARVWLFGIAKNAIVDEQRKLQKRRVSFARTFDPEILRSTDPAQEDPRESAVLAAVKDLCMRDRELIALKYYADLSNVEIAEVLGISETNVSTRHNRIMGRLREACHALV